MSRPRFSLKEKETQFGSSKGIDYNRVNKNSLTPSLCIFSLIIAYFPITYLSFFELRFFPKLLHHYIQSLISFPYIYILLFVEYK